MCGFENGVLGREKVVAYCDLLCAEELFPVLDEVTSEEPVMEPIDGGAEFRWGLETAAPSSASFLTRLITVGRNLVDIERTPGSCGHEVG